MWHCVGLCLHVVCMFFDGHLHQMLGDVRWPVTPAIQHPFYWNNCRARGAHCPTNCWGCWSFVPWPPRFLLLDAGFSTCLYHACVVPPLSVRVSPYVCWAWLGFSFVCFCFSTAFSLQSRFPTKYTYPLSLPLPLCSFRLCRGDNIACLSFLFHFFFPVIRLSLPGLLSLCRFIL